MQPYQAPTASQASSAFNLKFIGYSGFLLKHQGITLLCYPWVSRTGAFLGSWYQFPPNDFLDETVLYNADYLYISHDHDDHFDEEFLKRFPKHKVTILIADFLSNNYTSQIRNIGFARIVTLKDWDEY